MLLNPPGPTCSSEVATAVPVLKTRQVPKQVIAERTAEVVGILDSGSLLNRRIHQLSGGQRQRVATAKALVRRPQLFLMDEPFSSLDAALRRQMRTELVRIHREVETTMVFVTHDQKEAMATADRIGIMRSGEAIQLGPPQSSQPSSSQPEAAGPGDLCDHLLDVTPLLRLSTCQVPGFDAALRSVS
jgi:ABC-type sugar transport system ATPase subunit